jgi:predicted acyl esterase
MYSWIYWENKRANEYLLRWYDYWLKGINTGIMDEPPVLIYDAGSDEWRYENEYPLVRTQWTKFYLRSNPARPEQVPQGLISSEVPAANEEPDRYRAPRGMMGLFENKPVLAYVTEPLKKALKLWGPLSLTLYASSATVETSSLAWFVRVGEVAPDGTLTLITKGNLKASFREVDAAKSLPGQPHHPFQKQVYVEPNKAYDYQIEIQPIFHTFKPGYKIWLQIASDDPDYINNNYSDPVVGPVVAENSIYHDSARPSHLLLPVIPDAPIIAPVKERWF